MTTPALSLAQRFGTLCARCRRHVDHVTQAVALERAQTRRAPTEAVAEVPIGRRSVLTVELVPSLSHVRIQLNHRRGDGALKPTPLRVTFHDHNLADVIAALQKAQSILGAAVPINPEPSRES